jgi:hypothetical protein
MPTPEKQIEPVNLRELIPRPQDYLALHRRPPKACQQCPLRSSKPYLRRFFTDLVSDGTAGDAYTFLAERLSEGLRIEIHEREVRSALMKRKVPLKQKERPKR